MKNLFSGLFKTLIVFLISLFIAYIGDLLFAVNLYIPLPNIIKHIFFYYLISVLIIQFYYNNINKDWLSFAFGMVLFIPFSKQLITNIMYDYLGYKIIGIVCLLYMFAIILNSFNGIKNQ